MDVAGEAGSLTITEIPAVVSCGSSFLCAAVATTAADVDAIIMTTAGSSFSFFCAVEEIPVAAETPVAAEITAVAADIGL